MACVEHPNYSGLRLGRNVAQCSVCKALYDAVKAKGVKETRTRKDGSKATAPPAHEPVLESIPESTVAPLAMVAAVPSVSAVPAVPAAPTVQAPVATPAPAALTPSAKVPKAPVGTMGTCRGLTGRIVNEDDTEICIQIMSEHGNTCRWFPKCEVVRS